MPINRRWRRKYTYNLVVVVGMQFQLCVMRLLLQLCSFVTLPELVIEPVL